MIPTTFSNRDGKSCVHSAVETESNASTWIPMVNGFFLPENELPVVAAGELEQFVGDMGIVTKDDGGRGQFVFDRFVFGRFVFGTVVAVVDEDIDRVSQRAQAFYGIAVENFTDFRVFAAEQVAGLRIQVGPVVASRFAVILAATLPYARLPREFLPRNSPP